MGGEVLSEEVDPFVVVDVAAVIGVNVSEECIHVGREYTEMEVERLLELVAVKEEVS